MTKSKKILIWIIVVLIASILLGLAVRVGMYYIEYRQEKAVLQYLRENKNNSPIRELVTAKGKPYQKSSIKYDIDGDGEKEIVYAGYDSVGAGLPRYAICAIGILSNREFYVKKMYRLTCNDYAAGFNKAEYVLQHGIPGMTIKSGKLLFQVHDHDVKDEILNTFTMTGQQGDHLVFNTESGQFVTSDWKATTYLK